MENKSAFITLLKPPFFFTPDKKNERNYQMHFSNGMENRNKNRNIENFFNMKFGTCRKMLPIETVANLRDTKRNFYRQKVCVI